MPAENIAPMGLTDLAATAATYDVLHALSPAAAAESSVHLVGPDGRTVAEMIDAQRGNPDFLAMRREYTTAAAAAAGIIHLGEGVQE